MQVPDYSETCCSGHPGSQVVLKGGYSPFAVLQVCVEEGDDAAAGVQSSLLAEARPRESPQGGEDKWRLVPGSFVVVEEPVPGARALLDIMLDSDRRQRLLEAVRSAPERPVLGAVARDDRAGSFE